MGARGPSTRNTSLSRSQRRNSHPRTLQREPIAIIGIGCRFPGEANDPNAFWQLLCNGVDAITEIPADRWNIASYFDPEPGTPGKTYARWGGFINGIDQFDAGFFGISPREAARMDPQQRLLLEVAAETFEDAGLALDRLAGSPTGVFIGISTNDYAQIQFSHEDLDLIDPHTPTGSVMSIAANRLSYCFDLRGPSLVVDTACSSSLVAAHLACKSLWNHECTLAVAGGVNVILCPENFIGFSRMAMLSPEGRCKAFDAGGDGFVRGEGVGVVLLKPLSQAVADGDPIYAVIRGTAMNQDGRTNGITVPNEEAQAALIREACQQAGVPPEKIQYVEAHGTGTLVGDPIEANALGAVLSVSRPDGEFCAIGSVKTNIGHLEAGAGIAGLIKTALALKHGLIPPSLHFQTPNPHIDFERLKLRVQQHLEPWPENGDGRYAGVNSFGFGGTNAHIVLSEPPPRETLHPEHGAEASPAAYLIPLSARSSDALQSLARTYVDFLKGANHPQTEVCATSDFAYNLSLRRAHHDHRLSLVARTTDELIEQLEAFLAGESRAAMRTGHLVTRHAPKLAFVFSGQGPQWWAMGRQLLRDEPVFRAVIEECDALFSRWADWSLMDELTADEDRSRLHVTSIAQPAIFALQVALAALWRSWGVEPDAVVGHSVGEVAAAHIAGALSLEDAAKVIFHRGRCMDLASSHGKMLGAGLTEEDARKLIAPYNGCVSLAAVNSPSSVTLSGDAGALTEISQLLDERGVFCSFLRVNYAFHSPQMDPVRDELLDSLNGLAPRKAAKPIFSTVTGKRASGKQFNADYWWRNVRQPVRFGQAVTELIDDGFTVFLELSPHPVLSNSVSECLQAKQQPGVALASLRRKEDERVQMLSSLGALYTVGYPMAWTKLFPDGGRHVALPRYPWQHEAYWHEGEASKESRLGADVHPLLGRRLKSALPTWRVELNRSAFPYLRDHQVQGHTVFPAVGYLEMAFAVAREMFGAGTYIAEEIDFQKALFLPDDGEAPMLQTTFSPDDSTFAIYSRLKKSDQQWTLHARGKVRAEQLAKSTERVNVERIQARCPEQVGNELCYEKYREIGLHFGPSFQGVERLWRTDGESLGRIVVPEHLRAEIERYLIHPGVFDSCVQALPGTLRDDATFLGNEVFLPVQVDQVRFYARPGLGLWSHAELVKKSATSLEGNIRALDEDGNVVVEIRGHKSQMVDTVRGSALESMDNWIYEFQWQLKPRPSASAKPRRVDFLPAAEELHARLQAEAARLNQESNWRSRYQEIEPDLNRLCTGYLVNAFRDLGWELAESSRVTVDELIEKFGVQSRFHRALTRLLDLQCKSGWLVQVGNEWEVRSTPPTVDADELWRSILERFPAFHAEMILTRNCGTHLAAVMRGETDPLQLIFPEGSVITSEHLYQDAPSSRPYNLLVAKAVSVALERLPEGRTVRLLEIGGGTAGLTSYVLPRLPADQVEYVFTDITPFFLHKAEQKCRDYPFVKYHLLDIEKEPTEQEFELHSFDFVLASNVLHATSDLRVVLGHVKKLLASDGLLILLENDSPGDWVDVVFGLTEGWWRFSDFDLRPSHPLLPSERWRTFLTEIGFTDPIAISAKDGEHGQGQAVIVARGPASDCGLQIADCGLKNDGNPQSDRWLIFADQRGIGRQLAEFLESRGDASVLIHTGEEYKRFDREHYQVSPDRPEDFQRLLDEIFADNQSAHGVIHCWSLDSAPTEAMTLATLEQATAHGCYSVVHFLQALAALSETQSPQLWLITSGAEPVGQDLMSVSLAQSPLCGLGRVLANEHRDLRCKVVDLGPNPSATEIESLCEELTESDNEDEIALRGRARYVPRLTRASLHKASKHELKTVNTGERPVRLEITTPGVFDNLELVETRRREPGPDEVEIQVSAATLNFRDVMKVLGIYPTDGEDYMLLGDECAGRIVAAGDNVSGLQVGDEVIAIAPGSLGSFVTTKALLTRRKPDHLSADEAATIPIGFLTASYALEHLGRISEGERVLIQAGTGGVGLAAIQIARRVGAEVFATAGSPEKRAFLRALGVEHVMDSRSLSFADEIMDATGGKGVDLVLNSLAGEAIPKGLACLAPYGRFLEIGKRDIYQNSKLGLRVFKNNLSLFAIDLSRVMVDQPRLVNRLLDRIMRSFETKEFHPLPYRLFPLAEGVNAFRHMAQAKHIGKIVLTVRNQEVQAEPLTEGAVSFRADATYLITGGMGGLGTAVAEWMVESGACHLVLMGRSGAASDEARRAVAAMEAKGARIVVAKADVSREDDVARVLGQIKQSPRPLRGIMHTAMVLDDGIVLQLNRERFKRVLDPKVHGAWNLHRMTLDQPLDFFVLFSSVTAVAGNPGQANYVAANTFLDALAHHRRLQGLPGLTINWGQVTDAGYVARHKDVSEYLDSIGIKGITSKQGVETLGRLLVKNKTQVGVFNADWRQWAKFTSSNTSPRFSLLISPEALDHQAGEGAGRVRDVVLAAAADERQTIIETYLTEQVARVLGTSASKLELERPLNEIGLDSLMMVELKNKIEREVGVALPTVELMRGPSLRSLSQVLLAQVTGADSASSKSEQPIIHPIQPDSNGNLDGRAAEALLEKIDELSEHEIDALLEQLDESQLSSLTAEQQG
jgi:acyl transferase domain-containing protein/aryl carrier-like protein/ubiquinone/menaquinone biosynthesis C-methylase UbiE